MEALVVMANEDGTFTLELYAPRPSSFLALYLTYPTFYLNRPNGTIFQTSPQRLALDHIPRRGDVVTFTCENFSPRSIPVNMEIFRVRNDVSWLDVVRDYAANKTREQTLNGIIYSIL
jgi:hypothetical protein